MEAVSKGARSASANQSDFDLLATVKRTIRHEANELLHLADRANDEFVRAIELLDACASSVVVTGMGKAGLIGQKISATLCSTGARSHFLHPSEAIHGDLGRLSEKDVVIAFSMSGETEELIRLLPSLKQLTSGMLAITKNTTNTLARYSDVVIPLGELQEADANRLAPSTSTTAMLAVGDALALTLSERRGFRSRDFAKFHPGGSLGRKLTKVEEVMRPINECRVALETQTVRDTIVTLRGSGRRTGAVMIVDANQKLVGVFTDSDLARLLEKESTSRDGDSSLDRAVAEVMTRTPRTIVAGSLMPAAVELLAKNQISELPVVDSEHQPIGLVDITDVISWFPNSDTSSSSHHTSPPRPTLLPFPPSSERQA